tara:strand:+ start:6176 stop:7912 length:1737 start_codon:yes stop_codon:yes gene_type:complete
MPGHTRSIYSRRQRMAPGQYDNPLADFLDRLPDYFNDYQRNQLALERQQLADKRYDDSQRIAKEQREKEQIRYNKAQQDKEDAETKSDYRRIIDALPKYDFEGKSRAARQFNYEDQAQFFDAQDESQSSSLSELRGKVSQIQNLGPNATFYDYDKIKISPEQISMLKERDSFAYDTLVKAKGKYDNQRETNMRTMSREDQNVLKRNLTNIANVEKQMIEEAQKIPSIDTDNKTAQEILNNLKKSGLDPSTNLKNLKGMLDNYQKGVDALYNKYRITAPVLETGAPTGTVVPAISPFTARPDYDTDTQTLASTRGEALDQNELVSAQYAVVFEPEESQEYKNAVELLNQQYEGATNVLDQGRDIDITTSQPLPGISGLTERLSLAGQQIQEGEREDSGFRINPDARAFSLPPEGKDNPEYYDRVARQFEIEAGKLSTLTLNPEQYEGAGRRGVTQKMVDLNNALRTRDNLVSQVRDLYKQIPKTKKFSKQIKMFKDIIEDNPTGLQVTLDREARGGKGAFKFNKNKLSKQYRQLLADVNKQLNIDEDQQPTQNLIQRLVNQSGALANPTATPQPIQLFE